VKKTKILFFLKIAIFLLYTALAFNLLVKDPSAFPDESSFSNTAYRLIKRSAFSQKPFEKQLTLIEKTTLTQYGPVYYLLLSLPIGIFGYNIYTVRLFSVFVGLLTLIVLYLLVKRSTKSEILSLASILLVGIDINFLRMARLGRMDILTAFLNLLAYLLYLRSYSRPSAKKYLLLGGVLSLSLLTHFFTGTLPLLVIFFHLLITKRLTPFKNKQFLLFLVPFSSLIIWLLSVHFLASPSVINQSRQFILRSVIPNLNAVKIVINDKLTFNQINFGVYFASLLILALAPFKNEAVKLWLLNGFISIPWIVWGKSFFYLGYIPLYLLPTLSVSLRLYPAKNNYLQPFVVIAALTFISLSLTQQIILTKYSASFSYQEFGQKLSDCLAKTNAKVYLDQLIPDPYFYLVNQRADLKIFYQKFHDPEQSHLKSIMPISDYVISYDLYRKIISSPQYKKDGESPGIKKVITQLNLKPDIARILYQNTKKTCTVFGDNYQSSVTVFSLTE